jgi:hypothetical protein
MTPTMAFPDKYRSALLEEDPNKRKNQTLRLDREVGKYKPEMVYEACAYNKNGTHGKRWGIFLFVHRMERHHVGGKRADKIFFHVLGKVDRQRAA